MAYSVVTMGAATSIFWEQENVKKPKTCLMHVLFHERAYGSGLTALLCANSSVSKAHKVQKSRTLHAENVT